MEVPMSACRGNAGKSKRDEAFSLETLAALSGVSERTIRYYITRGLLLGPVRGGRGAFYTEGHLRRLQEIREQQQRGFTLTAIERLATAAEAAERLPEPETWLSYKIAPDLVVQVRSGTSPWRVRQVRSALERLAKEFLEK
jgi:DNA-binding transcriptional MerR regulator